MGRRPKVLAAAVVVAMASIALIAQASTGRSVGGQGSQGLKSARHPQSCEAGQRTKIATAKLIIEYNSTDQDFGVHGAFDDQGWKTLCVFDPSGRQVLEVSPRGQLLNLTMAGIFFESREPPVSEFSFDELRAAFPEGNYKVKGRSFDGKTLVGAATFTHDVPAPPTTTSPELADDPEGAEKNPVPMDEVVIAWEPVTETIEGRPVDITGYQVIITKDVPDDPNGFSRPTYDVHVGPKVQSLPVPVEFLEPGTVYELEVLALEVSGNQTISVGFFATE